MKIILVFLFVILQGIMGEETEILDYCAKVAEESTETKVNLTKSSVDSKNYCVEGRTRVNIFDEVASGDQYVYLSEHYCANLQNYPISCEQYYNSGYYDYKAKANYQQLYADYKATGTPNSDCLGIARFVFCAEQFKYCNADDGNTNYQVCSFLCQIWQNRCPDYTNIYDRICAGGGGEGTCSYSYLLVIYIFLIFIY